MVISFKSIAPLYGTRRIVGKLVRKQKTEQDSVIIITGGEGTGKSTMMAHICSIIDEETGRKTEPSLQVAFKLKDFLQKWSMTKKFDTMVLDEGKDLMSGNWQNADLKTFENKMTSLRIESQIYIICITNPFKLMRYLREDKLDYVFHCTKRGTVKVFKGAVFISMLQRIKDFAGLAILDSSNKCLFEDSVPKCEGEFWEKYSKAKADFALEEKRLMRLHDELEYAPEVLKQARSEEKKELKAYTMSEVAKILHCSYNSISRAVQAKEIPAFKSFAGTIKIREEDIALIAQKRAIPITLPHEVSEKISQLG